MTHYDVTGWADAIAEFEDEEPTGIYMIPAATAACASYAANIPTTRRDGVCELWDAICARETRRNAKTVAPRRAG